MIRMLGRCCSARRSPSASLLYQFFSRRIPLLVLFGLTLVGSAAAQFTINTVAGNGQAQAPFKTAPSPGWMSGVAADASGNVFIAVSDTNVVMQLDPKGNFTVVAGTGTAGFSGDGGLATSAQLNTPVGVALDAKGNLYIADSGNQRVREVSNGVINTVAGNGTLGQTGDGGPATSAELANPASVALDSSGNLYILELGAAQSFLFMDVREVSNGTISTVQECFEGVCFAFDPFGARNIAVDASGNIYWSATFSSFGICFVLEFLPATGSIQPIAGAGVCGFSGDGGQAIGAQLNGPIGVAVDSSGNVYIADADNNRIRLVTVANGIINTVAGNGMLGLGGDGGPATNAELVSPALVAAAGAPGTFYIVDAGNQRVRKVSNGVVSTLVGNVMGSSGDGGPATSAMLSLSASVAVDASGNFYIAETGNHVVREVSNGIITTVAGNGTQGYSGDGGPATNAQLSGPLALAISASGDLYIADTGNDRIRKVSSGIITTVAGNGTIGYSGDSGPALNAQLKFPAGLAVDASGNLYIADTGNQAVREVSNGMITTIAGKGFSGSGGDGGPASQSQLNGPAGLALDSAGNLYIADSANSVVREISNGNINTIAGMHQRGFGGDNGPATSALLNYPVGVAVDKSNNVYIADGMNQRIREVSKGTITTLAGNGTIGFGGDTGPASSALLAWPTGVAVDGSGNVYVADTGNRRIRGLFPGTGTAPSCAPTVQTTSGSLTIMVTANCTDSNGTITSVTIDWGDGSQPASGATGTHTYAAFGTYIITVTATNNFGQKGVAYQRVMLMGPLTCTPLVQGTSVPLTVMVTANCSEANGMIASVTIDWGDGSQPSSGNTATHTYAMDGTYTITVTAIDNSGQKFIATQPVQLTVSLPPAPAGQPSNGNLMVTAPPGTPMVTFMCTQATGPNGPTTNLQQDYGITCTFSPSSATLSNIPTTVALTVHTTGGTTSLLRPPALRPPASPWLWAFLTFGMPLPAMVLLGSGLLGRSTKRRAAIRYVTLGLVCILLLILTSCGGGFMQPHPLPVLQTPTTPGNYALTVGAVDSTGFVQTSLIVPLTVTGTK